ncbi:MAG: rRNA pseudouridine synthase [Verrucomicrobia bacterium]|nr:rRNA pseudouridine synthase [Verrucomicrobiota bacterium]
MRLQKFLAEAGLASRRASEQIILDGRVSINGTVVTELGVRVDPVHDEVAVDGTTIKPKRKLYLALNKPKGYICSRQDPSRRRCIHDLLPKEWRNLFTVGRLDFDSEGLIFLTNDGEFSLRLTHPRFGIPKKYLVGVAGRVEPVMLAPILRGVRHEGQRLKAGKARLLKANNSHSLVELELTEGKNREVRRLFETQGLTVDWLRRLQIGPIRLGELPSGRWRVLSHVEVKSLLSPTTHGKPPCHSEAD